jgi:hypothetical protein
MFYFREVSENDTHESACGNVLVGMWERICYLFVETKHCELPILKGLAEGKQLLEFRTLFG